MSSGPGPPSTGPYQQNVPDRRSASIDPLKVLGARAIVNDVHALASGHAQDVIRKLSFGIDDDVFSAGLPGARNLVLRRDPSDHAATLEPDNLCQQQAHPAGSGMDESDVARLDRIEIGSKVTCRKPLHHHGRGGCVVDGIGNFHQGARRDRMTLGIASGRIGPGDPITDFQLVHSVADGNRATGALNTQNFRVRDLGPGHALAHADVHEVHARCGDFDDDMPRLCDRLWAIDEFHDIGTTDLFHYNGFQCPSPLLIDHSRKQQSFVPAKAGFQVVLSRLLREAPTR